MTDRQFITITAAVCVLLAIAGLLIAHHGIERARLDALEREREARHVRAMEER